MFLHSDRANIMSMSLYSLLYSFMQSKVRHLFKNIRDRFTVFIGLCYCEKLISRALYLQISFTQLKFAHQPIRLLGHYKLDAEICFVVSF